MTQEQKKCVGIWMDHRQAIFINDESGEFAITDTVNSEEYTGHKGEHTTNNAKRNTDKKYHKTLSNHLMNYDDIYLFGPGTSQEEMQNFLKEDLHFKNKKITLGTADQITDPQMVAQVRDFFS